MKNSKILAAILILAFLSGLSGCKQTTGDTSGAFEPGSVFLTMVLLEELGYTGHMAGVESGMNPDTGAISYSDDTFNISGQIIEGETETTTSMTILVQKYEDFSLDFPNTAEGGSMSLSGAITFTSIENGDNESTSYNYLFEDFTVEDGFFTSFSGEYTEFHDSEGYECGGSAICNGVSYSVGPYSEPLWELADTYLEPLQALEEFKFMIGNAIYENEEEIFTDLVVDRMGVTISGSKSVNDVGDYVYTVTNGILEDMLITRSSMISGTFTQDYEFYGDTENEKLVLNLSATGNRDDEEEISTLGFRNFTEIITSDGDSEPLYDYNGVFILNGIEYPADQAMHYYYYLDGMMFD